MAIKTNNKTNAPKEQPKGTITHSVVEQKKSDYEIAEEEKVTFSKEYKAFFDRTDEMLNIARKANLPSRGRYVNLKKALQRNAKNLGIDLS